MNFIQTLVDALALGSSVALFSLGIALVFGVMRLVNVAYGEVITAGAFTFALTGGLPFVNRVLLAITVCVVVSVLMYATVFRPLRSAGPETLLVASFTLGYLLQNAALWNFGAFPRSVVTPPAFSATIRIGELRLSATSLISLAVAAALLVGVGALLYRTRVGLEMRAAAEDFTSARLTGVRAARVVSVAFAVAGVLAAASSLLLVAQTGSTTPTLGLNAMLLGLIATVIGGLGSLSGAVIGGLVLGLLSTSLQTYLPLEARPFRDAFVFGIVFLVILFRPQGIVRTRALEERV